VFRNRSGTALKLLLYDGQGYWLIRKAFFIGMIGNEFKVPCGPRMLDRPTPRKIGIRPLRVVAQHQLFRGLRNPILAG
jgi:hypothetical protein